MIPGTLTVKDRPKHHAIGRFFFCNWDSQVYYCDSFDPQNDFWMTNVVDPTDRRAVVGRAIGNGGYTFSSVDDSWKPLKNDELLGREYWAVDTRVAPELLSSRKVTEEEAMTLDERVAIFFWEGDDKTFIRKIQAAAAKRKQQSAAFA